MSVFTVAGLSLRRFARDRTALTFVIVLPVVVIVVIGATVRGFSDFRVAIVDQDGGALARRLVAALEDSSGLKVTRFSTTTAARTAVRRAESSVAVVIPSGFSDHLERGGPADVDLLGDRASSTFQAASSSVASVIAGVNGSVQAARFASSEVGVSFDDALARSDSVAKTTERIDVVVTDVDTARHTLPEGFSYSAPTMLVLFVFINALAGAATIIENRQLGLYERMAAGPLRRRSIIAGETLSSLTVALGQSALIVVIGVVVFGVSWGNWLAAGLLIVTWAIVGTGAGMLSGTLFRTPEQATSIGPALGIAFGMLGGCMWPLEIVAPLMRTIGHLVPQAWAVDAWTAVLSRRAGVGTIADDLAVLVAFAIGLLGLAMLRLGRRLT